MIIGLEVNTVLMIKKGGKDASLCGMDAEITGSYIRERFSSATYLAKPIIIVDGGDSSESIHDINDEPIIKDTVFSEGDLVINSIWLTYEGLVHHNDDTMSPLSTTELLKLTTKDRRELVMTFLKERNNNYVLTSEKSGELAVMSDTMQWKLTAFGTTWLKKEDATEVNFHSEYKYDTSRFNRYIGQCDSCD